MDNKLEAAEDAKFAQVPQDFPKPMQHGAVPVFSKSFC